MGQKVSENLQLGQRHAERIGRRSDRLRAGRRRLAQRVRILGRTDGTASRAERRRGAASGQIHEEGRGAASRMWASGSTRKGFAVARGIIAKKEARGGDALLTATGMTRIRAGGTTGIIMVSWVRTFSAPVRRVRRCRPRRLTEPCNRRFAGEWVQTEDWFR